MVCDPEATGGGAIASTLTGVDTITKGEGIHTVDW